MLKQGNRNAKLDINWLAASMALIQNILAVEICECTILPRENWIYSLTSQEQEAAQTFIYIHILAFR